jgi:PAS domain S-box-containing protein
VSTAEQPRPPAEDLESLLEFETLLADISSRFINLPSGQVDLEIEDALRRFCELLGIDLALLWQRSGVSPDMFTPTHVYLAPGLTRPSEPVNQDHYPWCRQQMFAGRVFAVTALEELPPEAAVDRETLRIHGVKSALGVPLWVGGEVVGCLGLNCLRASRDWPDALVHRLQLVGQVFANAIARRAHELKLRESEEISRATFEQAAVGIAHVGTDGRWLRLNDRLCAIVGYAREELLRLTSQDITHSDDLATDLDYVRQLLSGEIETCSVEKRYVRKDGSPVWASVTVSLVRRATGEPRHFIAVVEDITERKHAGEALRVSEARLTTGADLAGLAFFEVDFGAGTMFTDDRFRELCGVPPDWEQGLQILEFWKEHLHPEDAPHVEEARRHALDGKLDQLRVEYRYLHPTRGEIWIHHIDRAATRDATGRGASTYGVLRDITERRRAEESLRLSYEEIKRLKDRLQVESDYLKAEINVSQAEGDLTGKSTAIQKVLRLVEQVAPTDSSVLLRGETGTGKELVAGAIHQRSARHHHVMVKVNCAALPAGLVESELFGRERGAFTGALTRQIGRFEVADGSTLFLDEIGELSLDLQAKLLRVLEAGEFERLGSPRTIKVSVRMIAATNRDLTEAIRQGRFREDLYYRLNVFPIRVPPLRERPEDIPLLVWEFLDTFNVRMGKKITRVPRKTMEALQAYRWPGNVRELRNVVEHGVIVSTGDTLKVPMLDDAAPSVAALPQTLAEAEREIIIRTLERTGWHLKGPHGAAAALGLNPSTLRSRMKKLGIQPRQQPGNGTA